MNIKSWLVLVLLVASCTKEIKPVVASQGSEEPAMTAFLNPNVLFIVGDDIGYEVPTCDGGQSYSTPNIDALASNGMRFTQAHGLPLCAPSRVSLMTAEHNFRNYTKWGYLDPSNKTIGNMFSNNGYATCYAGKWQLDGGDVSIKGFGWQKYCVWLPFLFEHEYDGGNKYKSPHLYQDGDYLPDATTLNKYSEDMYTDYLINFIDSSTAAGKPFFAYYSMALAHAVFSPTPDDPEFATWDASSHTGNKKFFPSMIKYADKMIGKLYTQLQDRGLLENTIIVFVGDNGTPAEIKSTWNNTIVQGDKGQPSELGTNVPLIVSWKGNITPGTCNSLVGFTDFAVTLARLTNITFSLNNVNDGISFYPALYGDTSYQRTTLYGSLNANADLPGSVWNYWAQTNSYKVYDSSIKRKSYRFVKVTKGQKDSPPLAALTSEERGTKNRLVKILRSYKP